MTSNYLKRCADVAKLLCADTTRERDSLFNDFIEIGALNFSIACDPVHREARSLRRDALFEEYDSKMLGRFLEAFEIVAELALSNIENGKIADLFGYLFFLCGLADHGQEFTTTDLTRLMSDIDMIHIKSLPDIGFVDLYDSAVGSGSTLLSGIETLMKKGLDPNRHIVALGNDVALRCVHMSYFQLSLYGIPAVIIQGNTITEEEFSKWYTPIYIKDKWIMRKPFSMKGGWSRADELLKITTVPYYGATLEAYQLMCGTENKDGDEYAADDGAEKSNPEQNT